MENIKTLIDDSKLNLSTLIAFTRAEHKIHSLEYKTIKERGLTISQFGVLEVLYNKGDLRIFEIMEKILTTSGNITVVVKNLEKDGFIRKISDPLDKRSTIISITDKGIKIIEEILPEHIKNINNMIKHGDGDVKINLRNEKGDLRIFEIMEKILTTSGNITVVVKNLEKDGLIRKIPDPLDKRSTIISITDKGIKVIEEILPDHIKNINNIFNILTDEEKVVLKDILKKFK